MPIRATSKGGRPTQTCVVDVTEPEIGFRNPAIVFRSVVLPAPLRPTQATTSRAHCQAMSNRTFDSPYETHQILDGRMALMQTRSALVLHDLDLPVALCAPGITQTFFVSAVGDDTAFVHHRETSRKSSTCEILCSTIRIVCCPMRFRSTSKHRFDLRLERPANGSSSRSTWARQAPPSRSPGAAFRPGSNA